MRRLFQTCDGDGDGYISRYSGRSAGRAGARPASPRCPRPLLRPLAPNFRQVAPKLTGIVARDSESASPARPLRPRSRSARLLEVPVGATSPALPLSGHRETSLSDAGRPPGLGALLPLGRPVRAACPGRRGCSAASGCQDAVATGQRSCPFARLKDPGPHRERGARSATELSRKTTCEKLSCATETLRSKLRSPQSGHISSLPLSTDLNLLA